MAKRSALGLALLVMALSAWGIYGAVGWPLKAKLFPLVITIPLFCLAAAEVLWVMLSKSAGEAQVRMDDVARRRTLVAAGWTVGFFALILLVGFPIAVPLMVFAYVRLQGKERWLFSIVFAAAVWLFFYALFEWLLHLHFPDGWLFGGF